MNAAEPSPTREQAEAPEAVIREALAYLGIHSHWREGGAGGKCSTCDDAAVARESALAAVSLLVTERDALIEESFDDRQYQRELTRSLEAIARFIESRHKEGDSEYQVAIIAREALAGGGRTPTGGTFNRDLMSEPGGLGLSAEAVAEAGE